MWNVKWVRYMQRFVYRVGEFWDGGLVMIEKIIFILENMGSYFL